MEITWKTKYIDRINKVSKKKGWSCSDNNAFFDRVMMVYDSDAKDLKQFKQRIRNRNKFYFGNRGGNK